VVDPRPTRARADTAAAGHRGNARARGPPGAGAVGTSHGAQGADVIAIAGEEGWWLALEDDYGRRRDEFVARVGDYCAPLSADHVGMPDAATAIRVFNGLRHHLPLLEALGANSPFRHGRDTGLASAREMTLRSWPRAGSPRAMADYEDFVRSTDRLTRVAEAPDYTFHWWKLRPHPRIGTVEIRVLDTQLSPRHTAALAAAVHALARYEAQAEPVEGPPEEILDEASFRAGRDGVEATLPDGQDRLRPVTELLEKTIALAMPAARELRCDAQLKDLRGLLADGGGAGIQRSHCRDGGVEAVLGALVDRAPA